VNCGTWRRNSKTYGKAVDDGVSSLEPDLPPLPDAVAENPDDEDWLFDSRCNYMDQLMRYKTPEEVAEMEATMRDRRKACQWCGAEFIAKKKSGTYCSPNCRLNGSRKRSQDYNRRWRQERKEKVED
jgi:chromatin segregation and condensation protein Rec8/ScpA/Scc1 (kleisin family)